MKKLLIALFIGLLVFSGTNSAIAIKQFGDQFAELYVDESENEEYAALVKDAKCNLCHQGRKSKKNRNPYGTQLSELLDKKEDKKEDKKK